jgi:hypothetical protein
MNSAADPPAKSDPPNGDADRARLIVCERTGQWAVALRRELVRLGKAGVRFRETRSVGECWRLLYDDRASFMVVEVTPSNVQAVLERLAELERDFPAVRVAVVVDWAFRFAEPILREAGAVHFVDSPRRLKPLAEIACRHLDRAPKPKLGLVEQVWADLPWRESS